MCLNSCKQVTYSRSAKILGKVQMNWNKWTARTCPETLSVSKLLQTGHLFKTAKARPAVSLSAEGDTENISIEISLVKKPERVSQTLQHQAMSTLVLTN